MRTFMEQNWEIKMKLGEKQNGINCIVWFALILGLKKTYKCDFRVTYFLLPSFWFLH